MILLNSAEHNPFVIQTHREWLSNSNSTLLKKEILFLAQMHGQNIRLFKQVDGSIEAVFSHKPGYLLAESIYHYFGKPADLLYCEELPNGSALVVVIRSNAIFYSGKLPLTTLTEELYTLLSLKNKFCIFVYGNIPISTNPRDSGKLVFDVDQIASFTRLDKPVLPQLPKNSELELLSVNEVIKKLNLKSFFKRLSFGIVILFTCLGVYWLKSASSLFNLNNLKNPFRSIQTELTKPAPNGVLLNFYFDIQNLLVLPGWQITQFNYQNNKIYVEMKSLGGTLATLYEGAKRVNAQVMVSSQDPQLIISNKIPNRAMSIDILKVEEIIRYLTDAIRLTDANDSIQITKMSQEGNFKKVNLIIKFNKTPPLIFKLLSREVGKLPIVINKMNVEVEQGLLTGSLELIILGN